MAKNLVSGLILACFGPNLDPTDFFRAFRHHWKLMNQLEKMAKNIVSGRQFFFFKNLASSVTRYPGQLSSCTIPVKAIMQS